ncbi:MAG: hypothetical protein IJZ89_00815 [Clostridia bacterium]|nr:hypothetical protein [Clostridia bacterium]
MSDKDSQNADLVRLERENAQLQHRIIELEAELNRLRFDMGMDTGKDDISKLWRHETRNASLMGSRNYFKYLISLIKSTSFWSVLQKGISHFRKFRLLSAILRTATRIAVWAESGVALVAWLSFSVFMLPFIGVLSLISLFIALFRSRSSNIFFTDLLRDKKVYILFAGKDQLTKNGKCQGFFGENIKDLASDGSVVLVVSPYFFGRHGVGGRDFYVTARKESENIYMVRKNYFFMLRRIAIERMAAEIISIY